MFFANKRPFFISSSISLLFHVALVGLLSKMLLFRPPSVSELKASEPFFVIQEDAEELLIKKPEETIPVTEETPLIIEETLPITEETPPIVEEKNVLQEKIQEWWSRESESVEKMQQDIVQETKAGLRWFSQQTLLLPHYVSRFSQIQGPNVQKKSEVPIQKQNLPAKKELVSEQKGEIEKVLPFQKARLKKQLPLQYPAFGERMGYEGLVKLRVHLNETGKILQIEIVESSSYKVLDESAQQQVANWLFYPALRGETTVESWLQIPVRFKLN
ncbi:MAG: energy transducer TonB [Planctomycetota bacterium]